MKQAFRQFRSYPLQSVLIILAIALGVAVVTMVAASLQATNAQSAAQEDQLWSREIRMVEKKNDWAAFYQGGRTVPVREVGLASDEKVVITLDDLQKAKEAAPAVNYAYLAEWATFSKAQKDGSMVNVEVASATADFVEAARLKVTKGSLPSDTDFAEQRKVMVLSSRGLEQLGVTEDVVGQTVELMSAFDGSPTQYTVIGILEKPKNNGGIESTSLVPYSPPTWNDGNPTELIFAVADAADLDAARDQLASFARNTWVSVSQCPPMI